MPTTSNKGQLGDLIVYRYSGSILRIGIFLDLTKNGGCKYATLDSSSSYILQRIQKNIIDKKKDLFVLLPVAKSQSWWFASDKNMDTDDWVKYNDFMKQLKTILNIT
jgi:hypothetical protein